jgi:hypothetical protein
MKLLFVDHVFHKKTRSSEFFKVFLREFFDFEETFVDPENPLEGIATACAARTDIVLIWQLDFLAPVFLAAGYRTVVVPMYDGSANMPDLHWLWARQARFLNFSRRLHDRIRRSGGDSMLVKYFPTAQDTIDLPSFDKLHVFLWQRRPEDGISLSLAERLLGSQIASLHIHNAPDNPKVQTQRFLERSLSTYELTISQWLANSSEYFKLLDQSNVFIAPRRSEGIGLAMIEAMGRGMVVVAADQPVHDEYIANWVNGVLFNAEAPNEFRLDRSDAIRMSRMAWRTVADGHERWRDSLPEVLNYIRSSPAPTIRNDNVIEHLAEGLCNSYLAGDGTYKTYLFTHMNVLGELAGEDIAARVGSQGEYLLNPPTPANTSGDTAKLPWLAQNRLKVSDLTSGRFVRSGKFHASEGVAWIIHHSVTLGFRLDPTLGVTNVLQVSYCCPRELTQTLKLCVSLNGWTLWNDNLPETEGQITIPVLPQARAAENTLLLLLNEVAFGHGREPVSFGVRQLAFT